MARTEDVGAVASGEDTMWPMPRQQSSGVFKCAHVPRDAAQHDIALSEPVAAMTATMTVTTARAAMPTRTLPRCRRTTPL
jgi:hypothetical protein